MGFALVLEVVGEINGRHPAFAQVAFEPVTVREGGREPGGDLGHINRRMSKVAASSHLKALPLPLHSNHEFLEPFLTTNVGQRRIMFGEIRIVDDTQIDGCLQPIERL